MNPSHRCLPVRHCARLAAGVLCLMSPFRDPAAAQAIDPSAAILDLDPLFAEGAGGQDANSLAWAPDGRRLAYLWDEGQGQALWILDTARPGSPRLAVELGERAWTPRDADPTQRTGTGYTWAPDGDALLLQLDGDLVLARLDGTPLRSLTATPERESDPRFSPDGRWISFVRGFDLHLLDLTRGEERALTGDGDGDRIRNGVPDWVYWEEIWGREGRASWWSPDSRSLAYLRFDDTAVGRYPLSDLAGPYPEVHWQRYPIAGSANPRVSLAVHRLTDDEPVWMEVQGDDEQYLARVDWTPDGKALWVQTLNRDQTRLTLWRCAADSGNCSTVLEEHAATWVNLATDYRFLQDGRILWPSERSGWRQIYLYEADGSGPRQLTQAPGAVTSIEAVDERRGLVTYAAHGAPPLGAAGRKLYRVPLAGGTPEVLTPEPAGGWHSGSFAPGRSGFWVHTWNDANDPGYSVVRDRQGRRIATLPTAAPTAPGRDLRWETFALPGPDGTALPAQILRPAAAGAAVAATRPALMYHYGGPASQMVVDRWDGSVRGLWMRHLAAHGITVLRVDNAGSAYFGKHGEDRMHRRFGEFNLAAQLAGVEYLKGLDTVDPQRIGLWGWSGGGANTLYCLTRSPGTWRAGVAGAPVTDWRYYDSVWTERYLDTPEDNPDGYAASSPIHRAEELRDALLLVHGTADDNVHPNNSFDFAARLTAAGLPYEMLVLPGQKHGLRGTGERRFYDQMTAFFVRELLRPSGDAPATP